jgi:hypothetical protein
VKPPVRWLDAKGGAPSGARELLTAAAPAPEFTDALRYRLGVGVAKTATLPVTSAWTGLVAKGALVVALGGGSGYAVHAVAGHHDATSPSAAAPVAAAPRAHASAAEPPPIAVEALPALQLPTAPAAAPRLKVDPRLEEAELLEKARSLVGSNPAAALRLTQDHARDFPRGRLGAEADLIAAQSLVAMGKASAARERAKQSLSRYPSGLYARQLRDIAER